MSERPNTIDLVFAGIARRTPQAIAVAQGSATLTYEALDRRSTALAEKLRALGVGREVVVALQLDPSLELIVAMLGVVKAGGIYLAISRVYPAERVAWMLEDSRARVVLRSPAELEAPALWGSASAELIGERGPTRPEDVAALIYTSGSTGRPKGVELTHRGIVELLIEANFLDIAPGDVWAQVANISFDGSIVEIFGALLHGARLELLDRDELFDPQNFARRLRERRVTSLFLTTGLLNELGRIAPDSFRGLKLVHFGGDVADPKSVRAILEHSAPNYLINGYGPTECTACAIKYHVTSVPPGATSIPIGRPLTGSEVLLIDGELYLGGARIARGYWRRPELTAERFIAHPTKEGERIYKTGDLARRTPDGEYEFLGRADSQVKIRGYRVELQELEAILSELDGVEDAVVVARLDARGEKQLFGYVVPAEVDPGVLRIALAGRVPQYMVPQAIVALDRFPLTANGKIDRRALPAPVSSVRESSADGDRRTETESKIAALFSEVLGAAGTQKTSNFFELGGHSLSAMQLIARARSTFDKELPLRVLFEHPTLSALAAAIDRAPPRAVEIPPIIREPDAPAELTHSQGRVWFMESLDPGNIAYNSAAVLRIRGALDVPSLERSLSAMIQRHESLRTVIEVGEDGPRARVRPAYPVALNILARPGILEQARTSDARAIGRADAERPFDPRHLPLVRWTLIRYAPDDHALVQIEHHLVHDGWSFNVFLRELWTLYRGGTLDELPVQLSDFARWHRALSEGEAGKKQIEYWKNKLAALPVLELPTTRPRPSKQTFRGRAPRIELPAPLIAALAAVAQREGTTTFVVMLAAFKILLSRWAGQDEVVVGTGAANRRTRESESLIGMLVNNLVLRTDLGGAIRVREAIARVKETALEAFEHQDVSFDRVVEAVRPARDPSRNPLFQVMFSFHDTPMPAVELPGLEVDLDVALENGTAKIDLSVIGIPAAESHFGPSDAADAGAMTLIFEHNAELFDPPAIQRLIDAYRRVLEQLPGALDRPISALELLSEEEKEELLFELNDTRAPYPRDATVHALFEQRASRAPDRVALISGDGRTTSYGELSERSGAIAAQLLALGVAPGDRVGLVAGRKVELVAAMLGILKAGAAYVPLDPAYPEERLRTMLNVATPSVLCGEAALLEKFGDVRLPRLVIDRSTLPAPATAVALPEIPATSSAYLMFTSGSTGEPRAVDVPHRAIVRLVIGADYAHLESSDIFMHLSPISFDASTFELWAPLLNGGRCVLFPEQTPSPRSLRDHLERHGVTTLWLTSSLFNAVIDDAPEALSSLRQLLVGGEALSVPHIQRASAQLPRVQLINGYGPTESTTFACCFHIPRPVPEQPNIPIGKAIANTTAYVLDRDLNPVPIGVPGELYLGGDGLARGYFARPALTAEKFIENPFSKGEKLYRTGDRVRRREDRNLEFLGRADQQVKVRGFRVELGELENISGQVPGVRTAAAVLQQVNQEKKIVLFIAPEPGVELAESALRAQLRHRLPEHAMPAVIAVIPELPVTPVGKVDRRALAQHDVAGATPAKTPYARPVDPSERIMAEIWERLLGVSPVGRHDNFFELGGHSLLAARLVDEMERALGVRLPLTAVFGEATIAVMARKLREKAKDAPLLAPLNIRGRKPPLFFLHGDFNGGGFYTTRLAPKLGPDQPFYIVHPFGVHGGSIPRTVESMAAQYIAEIRRTAPHGPYRIGGYCTGGLIAFEVARVLEASGERIDRLILVDAVPKNVELTPIYSAVGKVSEDTLSRLHQRMRKPLLARAWLRKKLAESEGRPIGDRLRSIARSVPKNVPVQVDPAVPAPESEGRAFQLLGIYRRVMSSFVPRPFAGRLTVLWPEDDPHVEEQKLGTAHWHRLAREVEIRNIPGTHATCLTTHWEALAEELAGSLEDR